VDSNLPHPYNPPSTKKENGMRNWIPGLVMMIAMIGFALPATAETEDASSSNIGGSIRFWMTELDASSEVIDTDFAPQGTDVDFGDDLDVDEDQTAVELYVWFRFMSQAIHLNYLNIEYDGSATLSQNITVDDTTFTAGDQVDSEFGFYWFTGKWEFTWEVDASAIQWEVGLMVGLGILGLSTDIDEELTGTQSTSQSETAPFPLIGARIRAAFFDGFYAEGVLNGFSADNGDIEVAITDLTLEVGYQYEWISFGAGIRSLAIGAEGDDGSEEFDADVNIAGLYVHAGVQF
jgi:hypothetical protein